MTTNRYRISVTVSISDLKANRCLSEAKVDQVREFNSDSLGATLSELAHKAISLMDGMDAEIAAYCMADYVGKNHRQELVEAARNAELLT